MGVPPPIAPPRGLSGLFDNWDPNELLDNSKFGPNQVYINVYDLGDSDALQKINAFTTANNNVLIGGIFHAGVEVYGGEWCFGFTEEDRSGVSCIPPRTHPQHTYRTTIPLGATNLSRQEVGTLTARLTNEWRGNGYNLIHNNCQNFCNAMSAELGVGRIPGWVDRAARAASAIDITSRTAANQAHKTAELLRSASLQVDETVRGLITADEQEYKRMATETADKLHRGSTQALDEAAKMADVAAQRAQELAEVAKKEAERGATVVKARTQELLGNDVVDQAQEVAMQTQESVRALGAGLWSFGQDLQKAAGIDLGSVFGGPGQASSAQGRGAKVSKDLCCPQGHGLRLMAAKRGSCDGCGMPVEEGARVMDCRQCNWYLCGSCAQRAAATKKENRPPAGRANTPAAGAGAPYPASTSSSAPPLAPAAQAAAPAAAPAPAPAPVDLLGDIDPIKADTPVKSEPLDLLGDPLPVAQAAPKQEEARKDVAAADEDQE